MVSPAVVVFVYHRGRSLLVSALFTGTGLPTLVGLAGKGRRRRTLVGNSLRLTTEVLSLLPAFPIHSNRPPDAGGISG
jgi:hypothetical protein